MFIYHDFDTEINHREYCSLPDFLTLLIMKMKYELEDNLDEMYPRHSWWKIDLSVWRSWDQILVGHIFLLQKNVYTFVSREKWAIYLQGTGYCAYDI